jgi:hypothetical protein
MGPCSAHLRPGLPVGGRGLVLSLAHDQRRRRGGRQAEGALGRARQLLRFQPARAAAAASRRQLRAARISTQATKAQDVSQQGSSRSFQVIAGSRTRAYACAAPAQSSTNTPGASRPEPASLPSLWVRGSDTHQHAKTSQTCPPLHEQRSCPPGTGKRAPLHALHRSRAAAVQILPQHALAPPGQRRLPPARHSIAQAAPA